MAIHGSQSSLNIVRQPKPRKAYAVPRFRVTLVRDNRAVPPSLPLCDSVSAAAMLRPLFAGLDREQFLVCGLDARHCIIGANIVSVGSLTFAIVHPREVFKPLILMNAAAWICRVRMVFRPHPPLRTGLESFLSSGSSRYRSPAFQAEPTSLDGSIQLLRWMGRRRDWSLKNARSS